MLELKHVSKIYKEEKSESVNALIDINLSFPNTGLVVISGASGCGKTTLLNILGGLDRPTTGEVKLNNNRIDNQNEEWWDSFRALYLGFIYQDFNLLENMSVRENIQLPLDIRMLDVKTKQEMTENIIDELWKEAPYVLDRTVDVHIARIRSKLGARKNYLTNRTGYGYVFNVVD